MINKKLPMPKASIRLRACLLKLLSFLPLMGALKRGMDADIYDTDIYGGDTYDERSVYNFEVTDIDGKAYKLEKYKGDVIIIVNVASKCKLANKSYTELAGLLEKHSDKGLRILLFPCSQFLDQEHEQLAEIKKFANDYSTKFILMDKVEVKGDNIHPLFAFLVEELPGTFGNYVKWNFTYFLIDRKGIPTKRYSPTGSIKPNDKDLLKALEKDSSAKPTRNYAL